MLVVALPSTAHPAGPLRVGLHEDPPYVVRNPSGEWDGLAVQLWRQIALQNSWQFDFVELPYEGLVPALRDGKADVVVGELAVDPSLEREIDFSQPFLFSSLGVVARSEVWSPDWIGLISGFLNPGFLQILAWIFFGLVIVGGIIWLLERKHHSGHFGGSHLEGFGSALWFSAATMTSVGYGDKTPSTFVGRFIAFIWMLVGVLIVAAFTGAVASAISVSHFRERVMDPYDLRGQRTGVLSGSMAAEVLPRMGIRPAEFEVIEDGIRAVAEGRLSAFVGDRISLGASLAALPSPGCRLLPLRFNECNIALGLPQGSPLLESVNVSLLETVSSPEWISLTSHWLGDAAPSSAGLKR
ncbi:MAG: transporter substrate-binding domain-containing protein [Terrimicrobiaceae bacterium]